MIRLPGLLRRLRFGQAIVVVSGLPRSGTSMAMRMLEAGGMTILTDAVRQPDESNPHGYFELEAVKDLHTSTDTSWLDRASGKAVKIVSLLLTWLPEDRNYQVIFMRRDLGEIIASQRAMLRRRGEDGADDAADIRLRGSYETHLTEVARFLAHRACFSTLYVDYVDAMRQPLDSSRRMSAFLGRRLNLEAMARAIDPALYRNRVTP